LAFLAFFFAKPTGRISFVVSAVMMNADGPVDLFKQHDLGHFMREGHGRQAQHLIG
jgi:hypothetical protein